MKREIQSLTLLLIITGMTTAVSCKKDKDPVNNIKTKTELLTTGTWKLTAYTSSPAYDWYGNGVYATDILAALDPCQADGFDTYKTNGIMGINEGAIKCQPTDPQTYTATWAFVDNETKILYDGFDEYVLVELTATTMKLKSTFVENGVSYTHYETFTH